MRFAGFFLICALALVFSARQVPACGLAVPCVLGERSYHLRLPDGWDGVRPLAVLMHFHGWMRQGDLVVRHARIAGATRHRDVILVAPNGRAKTWDFRNPESADVTFAARVLSDVMRRFPTDPARVYVSGYSYGGAMAWRFACQRGERITALLAIAGSLGQSEGCPQAPGIVRHVHGTADTVMRTPVGPGGDVTHPVALWRRHLGCGAGSVPHDWQARTWLTFTRRTWVCDNGQVTLDLHPGGHFIPHGWIAAQLDALGATPAARP